MTRTEMSSNAPDPRQLYLQVMAFLDYARPLADQFVAAGSTEEVIQIGRRIAAQAFLGNHEHAASRDPFVVDEPHEVQDANDAVLPPRNSPDRTTPVSRDSPIGGLPGAVGSVVGGVMPALYVNAALQGARLTADFMRDYVETVQRETTRRHDITTQKEIRLQEIETAKAVMEQYLTATFDERRSNFHELFQRLDRAQDQGDLQGMQLVLGSILDLAKSSPFKDLATFKKHLDDPAFVLEL